MSKQEKTILRLKKYNRYSYKDLLFLRENIYQFDAKVATDLTETFPTVWGIAQISAETPVINVELVKGVFIVKPASAVATKEDKPTQTVEPVTETTKESVQEAQQEAKQETTEVVEPTTEESKDDAVDKPNEADKEESTQDDTGADKQAVETVDDKEDGKGKKGGVTIVPKAKKEKDPTTEGAVTI